MIQSPKIIKAKHGEAITDPKLTADNFNIFLAQSVQSVQAKINYAFKSIQGYLSKPCNDPDITRTEDEISKIMFRV